MILPSTVIDHPEWVGMAARDIAFQLVIDGAKERRSPADINTLIKLQEMERWARGWLEMKLMIEEDRKTK